MGLSRLLRGLISRIGILDYNQNKAHPPRQYW